MAERLKGITVEIGGDTVGLNAALKDVNQESRALQTELSDVQKLLKFNPDNAELLAQRQTLLNRQIETTSHKLQELKSVERQVQEQFNRGDIGEEAFRRFQREVIATEGRLEHFQRQAQETSTDVKGKFKNMGAGIANGIAGALAGAGIQQVISKSLESASMTTKIKVGFDVPKDAVGKISEIISGIQAYGIEGEAALEGVRKQFALNGDMSVAQNQKIVQSAAVIARTYADIDFTELIQESNEFGDAIGISQQDALAMTNQLLKMGFPPDQLDIMSEYGAQLHRAGYNAQEIQGIFAAGVETKSWNIDVLLDGVKEGRIRLAEFGTGVDETTTKMISGTSISADKLKGWGAAVAEGGQTGKVAFGEVATELSKVKDEAQRNAIGTRLFGTLWEEQGKKITDSLAGANTKAGDMKTNTDNMNKAVSETNADPQVQLSQALTNMNNALTPLLTMVADFVAKVAEWVGKNPELAATITAITVALGIIIGIFIAILPIIALLTAENIALAASFLPILLPILAIIAIIAVLIAIGVLLYKNWDKIMAKVHELGAAISKKFHEIAKSMSEGIENGKKWVQEKWDAIMKFFRSIDLKKIGKDIIQGLIDGMHAMWNKVKEKAHDIANTVKQALKDKLKLKSPSKVTMEIGENVGLGMVQGMHDSIGRIQSMSHKMANASLPNISTPKADVAAGTTKSMIVNINSPKALDVREANKEFNRTMGRMSQMW